MSQLRFVTHHSPVRYGYGDVLFRPGIGMNREIDINKIKSITGTTIDKKTPTYPVRYKRVKDDKIQLKLVSTNIHFSKTALGSRRDYDNYVKTRVTLYYSQSRVTHCLVGFRSPNFVVVVVIRTPDC